LPRRKINPLIAKKTKAAGVENDVSLESVDPVVKRMKIVSP
jgi:hypothetical protein